MNHSESDATNIEQCEERARSGDHSAMLKACQHYRERLKRMVALRLDRRIQGRVDASDIVQDAIVEAERRYSDYVRDPSMDFFLWLRWITSEKLLDTHRFHLGAKKRSAENEVSLYRQPLPEANSITLAQQLIGRLTSPTQAYQRAEMQLLVQQVLNELVPIDREILVLRHFEQLTTSETATVLGIARSTAGKRYISAMRRLKHALGKIPAMQQYFD